MTMDVTGKNPIDQIGEHFSRNTWSWCRLAQLVVELCPRETAACKDWYNNSGDGLDADAATKLADALQGHLEQGAVNVFIERIVSGEVEAPDTMKRLLDQIGKDLPVTRMAPSTIDVETVRAFIAFLRRSGGFEIW